MYIGSLLTRYFSGIITFMYEEYAAFSTEELDLWYNGGLADMAIQVEWKWQAVIEMLEKKRTLGEFSKENAVDHKKV
jgi:hypothetical protein